MNAERRYVNCIFCE